MRKLGRRVRATFQTEEGFAVLLAIVVIAVATVVYSGSKKKDPHDGQHCVHSSEVTGDCDEWEDD